MAINLFEHPLITNFDNSFFKNEFNSSLIIAGPCSVEDYETTKNIALELKKLNVNYLRAGAFKPRTSVYDFQGLEKEGLEILKRVKKETNIKIVTEIPSADLLPLFDFVDIIQVGARNMQNFTLLKALGQTSKPIILKRGFGNTIEELLYASEYIMNEGNKKVILCERGIRTFENVTRSTLDISSIAYIKTYTNLPIIVDPSHASGDRLLVTPLCLAGIACGADGAIIEVHQNPSCSISDANQALDLTTFKSLLKKMVL